MSVYTIQHEYSEVAKGHYVGGTAVLMRGRRDGTLYHWQLMKDEAIKLANDILDRYFLSGSVTRVHADVLKSGDLHMRMETERGNVQGFFRHKTIERYLDRLNQERWYRSVLEAD